MSKIREAFNEIFTETKLKKITRSKIQKNDANSREFNSLRESIDFLTHHCEKYHYTISDVLSSFEKRFNSFNIYKIDNEDKYLVNISKHLPSKIITRKIRNELKQELPLTKFKVSIDYSGTWSTTISIYWEDSIYSREDVSSIASKYKTTTFDGMTDSTYNTLMIDEDGLNFYGVDGISYRKNLTDNYINKIYNEMIHDENYSLQHASKNLREIETYNETVYRERVITKKGKVKKDKLKNNSTYREYSLNELINIYPESVLMLPNTILSLFPLNLGIDYSKKDIVRMKITDSKLKNKIFAIAEEELKGKDLSSLNTSIKGIEISEEIERICPKIPLKIKNLIDNIAVTKYYECQKSIIEEMTGIKDSEKLLRKYLKHPLKVITKNNLNELPKEIYSSKHMYVNVISEIIRKELNEEFKKSNLIVCSDNTEQTVRKKAEMLANKDVNTLNTAQLERNSYMLNKNNHAMSQLMYLLSQKLNYVIADIKPNGEFKGIFLQTPYNAFVMIETLNNKSNVYTYIEIYNIYKSTLKECKEELIRALRKIPISVNPKEVVKIMEMANLRNKI